MIKIGVRIKIDKRKLQAFPKLVDKALQRGLQKGASEVERKGKIYAPYEHGDLFKSIRAELVKKKIDGWSVIIAPHVPYAEAMERPGRVIRRGRRPYMKPALKDSINKIKFHIIDELRGIR